MSARLGPSIVAGTSSGWLVGVAFGLLLCLLVPTRGLAQPVGPMPGARPGRTGAPGLPAGHPDVSGMRMPQAGAGPAAGRPRRGPESSTRSVRDDPALPDGTVAVLVLDGEEQPVVGAPVVLGMLRRPASAGAKPSSEKLEASTDAFGEHRFEELAGALGSSCWVSTSQGEAQFASEPFTLPVHGGARVTLHAYEPTASAAQAGVDVSTMVVLELHEESIGVDQLLRVDTRGPKAWVPTDLWLRLPAGYQAFETDETMSGPQAREQAGGVALTGTFAPGVTELRYGFQLPLDDTSEQSLEVPLPPACSSVRVVAAAAPGLGVRASGMPEARLAQSSDDRSVLVTERRASSASPSPSSLRLTLTGLPSPGAARWVALGLALLLAAGGAVAVGRKHRRTPRPELLAEARAMLLAELAELQRQERAGSMAADEAKAIREGLLDALGRVLQRAEPKASA